MFRIVPFGIQQPVVRAAPSWRSARFFPAASARRGRAQNNGLDPTVRLTGRLRDRGRGRRIFWDIPLLSGPRDAANAAIFPSDADGLSCVTFVFGPPSRFALVRGG